MPNWEFLFLVKKKTLLLLYMSEVDMRHSKGSSVGSPLPQEDKERRSFLSDRGGGGGGGERGDIILFGGCDCRLWLVVVGGGEERRRKFCPLPSLT